MGVLIQYNKYKVTSIDQSNYISKKGVYYQGIHCERRRKNKRKEDELEVLGSYLVSGGVGIGMRQVNHALG